MDRINWKIEKIVKKGNYNYAIVRNHPNRTKNDYVLEHRIVVENHIQRLLEKDEIVHHINEIKKDNRIDNLQIMKSDEHGKHHQEHVGLTLINLICPECQKKFIREARQTKARKPKCIFTACSPKCRGKFSRKIQMFGYTNEIINAINNNLGLEFNSKN